MLKISKVLISIFFIYIIGFASGIYKFPPYSTLIKIKTYLDTNSKINNFTYFYKQTFYCFRKSSILNF